MDFYLRGSQTRFWVVGSAPPPRLTFQTRSGRNAKPHPAADSVVLPINMSRGLEFKRGHMMHPSAATGGCAVAERGSLASFSPLMDLETLQIDAPHD